MRIVLGSRCNTEVVAVGPGNRFAQMITDDEFGLRLLQSDQSFTGGLILAFVPSTLIVYIHAGQTGAQIPLPSPESWNASETIRFPKSSGMVFCIPVRKSAPAMMNIIPP